MPTHASQLYARNVASLLGLLVTDGELTLDLDDEIIAGACVTRKKEQRVSHNTLLVFELTILVLAIFLGFEVISKVPTLLHTPLMSGTNAIHGIVIVGAMLVAGDGRQGHARRSIVGFVAVVLATANVVGGFVVTDRMLEMFKKREPKKPTTRSARRDATSTSLYLVDDRRPSSSRCSFLSSPAHARRGNQIGAVGMLLAIVVTLSQNVGRSSYWEIAVGMRRSAARFGAVGARKVKMTAMPQMVALFNGVGGGAAALVALAEFHRHRPAARAPARRRQRRDRPLGADRLASPSPAA